MTQPTVKLSPFWPQAPALWFAQAECAFTVKHIEAQFDRYCHVVSALPHESLRLVADLVESPPTETPYDDIKTRLVASHQLSDFQKAEKLFLMPPLGSRKPSEMMAAMLETCPRGEEKTNLFACIFLQRLPREIRVLLARVDQSKIPEFWGQKSKDTVTAIVFIRKIEDLARTNHWTDTATYAHVANAFKGFAREWLFATADMLDWTDAQLTWMNLKPRFQKQFATQTDDKQEYMHWHYKLNHPSYTVMSRMAKQHMLPRRITRILKRLGKQDTKPPMCNDCCGAKATRRPWRTTADKRNISHIKSATKPGEVVSVDQLESSIPGFIGQMTGKLTRQRIIGTTVYVDHASDFSFVYHQTSMSSEETVKSKVAFEKFAATHGVNIKHYHADNGRFKDNLFMKSIEEKGQTITFCGVGAHHQNGKAEKRIGDLQRREKYPLPLDRSLELQQLEKLMSYIAQQPNSPSPTHHLAKVPSFGVKQLDFVDHLPLTSKEQKRLIKECQKHVPNLQCTF